MYNLNEYRNKPADNVYFRNKMFISGALYSKFIEYNKLLDKQDKLSAFYYGSNAHLRTFDASYFKNKGILADMRA